MKGKAKDETGIESVERYIREQIKIRGIKHLSDILNEAKNIYREEIQKQGKDVEQSWKPFKGNLLEKIILEAISDKVRESGLEIIRGKILERQDSSLFFITLDEDGDLIVKKPPKKGRAIAEVDTDGTFVITTKEIQESEKVRKIEEFFDVLELLVS